MAKVFLHACSHERFPHIRGVPVSTNGSADRSDGHARAPISHRLSGGDHPVGKNGDLRLSTTRLSVNPTLCEVKTVVSQPAIESCKVDLQVVRQSLEGSVWIRGEFV